MNKTRLLMQKFITKKQINKGKFQFEHCWNVLRHQPKWLEGCQKKKLTRNKVTSFSTHLTDSIIDSYGESANKDISDPDFVGLERLAGRKAEKDRKKRKDRDLRNDSSSACVTLLEAMIEEKKQFNEKKMEMFERQFAQEQERLAYEKEKSQLEPMKDDERIMTIDTAGMPPLLAGYYRQHQMEILLEKNH